MEQAVFVRICSCLTKIFLIHRAQYPPFVFLRKAAVWTKEGDAAAIKKEPLIPHR